MYEILQKKAFKRQLNKLASNKKFDAKALRDVIKMLQTGSRLPAKYKDHKLKGNMSIYRECHVKSDLLLKYYKDDKALVLVLVELGTHSQMFGK